MNLIQAGIIGAGSRSTNDHYPCLASLDDVTIEAIAELKDDRRQLVVDQYGKPYSYKYYRNMLRHQKELDIVYVILPYKKMAGPAIECMDAGLDVFIEKPTGANLEESEALLDAALRNNVRCMVGYQRRFTAPVQLAMEYVTDPRLAVGEFHKPGDSTRSQIEALWGDLCHPIDLVRYMVGKGVPEVAYVDSSVDESGMINCFTVVLKFEKNAKGTILAYRTTGGRQLCAQLHDPNVSCRMEDIPGALKIWSRGEREPLITPFDVSGALPTAANHLDYLGIEGTLAMHRHIADCIQTGKITKGGIISHIDIRDVIKTSRLVHMIQEMIATQGS